MRQCEGQTVKGGRCKKEGHYKVAIDGVTGWFCRGHKLTKVKAAVPGDICTVGLRPDEWDSIVECLRNGTIRVNESRRAHLAFRITHQLPAAPIPF